MYCHTKYNDIIKFMIQKSNLPIDLFLNNYCCINYTSPRKDKFDKTDKKSCEIYKKEKFKQDLIQYLLGKIH